MYDLIGDIHGHVEPLKQVLTLMDYKPVKGVWQHPNRKVIFAGDFIDRGPAIREVLQIVRAMVDAGQAMAIMGNHEYNALAYAYALPDGKYLRSHSTTNTRQHQATLDQFKHHREEWQDWLQWFYTLPLFLDLGILRVVHACWDDEHIRWLKNNNHERLSEQLLLSSHNQGTYPFEVLEETLKGKEFNIPESFAWRDKDGHLRNANRIKWWIHPGSATYGDFLFNCPENLRHEKVPTDLKVSIYPKEAPPVFFGHYWMDEEFPVIQADNVICLDYSIAKGGSLVAYRWNGEDKLDRAHFVSVKGGE